MSAFELLGWGAGTQETHRAAASRRKAGQRMIQRWLVDSRTMNTSAAASRDLESDGDIRYGVFGAAQRSIAARLGVYRVRTSVRFDHDRSVMIRAEHSFFA